MSVSVLDINPLQHLTTDAAISQYNYESVMLGLVQWDQSKSDSITIRLAIRTAPYFVDYILHTKYYYDKTFGTTSSETLLAPNGFAYGHYVPFTLAVNDQATLRVNAVNNGDTSWSLYQIMTVYDEYDGAEVVDPHGVPMENTYAITPNTRFIRPYEGGMCFRIYDSSTHRFVLYRVADGETINENDVISTVLSTDAVYRLCEEGTVIYPPEASPSYELYVNTSSAIYTAYVRSPNKSIDTTQKMSSRTSGYMTLCKMYLSGTYDGDRITRGTMVYYQGDLYISSVDAPPDPPIVVDTSNDYVTFNKKEWTRVCAMPVNNAIIRGSGIIRVTAATDLDGYVLRNVGSTESDASTNISITGTFTIKGESTPQATGVNILPTSNFVSWPNQVTKWADGAMYTTNASLSAFSKQSYSAVMVFDHTDTDHFKYKNIINYDGPDLDQGLCIMLPVTVVDSNNMSHDPDDGTMLEFMFNIWPNHKYDGRAANDLIINKSQIYVYSVPNLADYAQNGFNQYTVEPIAKFSMARLVNFYMFAENVGVPDRPVCYKARFIYSANEHRWKTYDYYQLPDHIFMSPNGFVDPSQPEAYGVQTAGFPLYQNPFSDYNLSAIHVDDKYRNQIQYPGEQASD